MLEFIDKYFLLGNNSTPIDYIIFFLISSLCFTLGNLGYIIANDVVNIKKQILSGIAGLTWFLFLIWLFLGESTLWSEPIGNWLLNK